MMRSKGVLIKFLTFSAVSILLVMLLFNTMANNVGGKHTDYQAMFTNVSGLRTGDEVRVAGVKVGRVQSIEVVGRQAKVGFYLAANQPLLSNTQLVMRYQNLLGQRYVSIVQPDRHGARLKPGATVPTARTSPGFDLTALLNGFRPLFDVLKPEDINKLSTTIVKVLQGEGGTVDQLLRQVTQLTNYLADREQVFDQIVDNLTPVLQNLSGQGTQLQSTVVELNKLMTGFARNKDTFGASVEHISQLIGTTSSLVQQARRPLARDVRSLRQVAKMYADQGVLFGQSLTAFGDLLGTLGRAFSYQSALNVYVCTLDLNVAGVKVGSTAVGSKYSEVCR